MPYFDLQLDNKQLHSELISLNTLINDSIESQKKLHKFPLLYFTADTILFKFTEICFNDQGYFFKI